MKIINPEKQTVTGSTSTSTDANFPLANLFDDHPRNVTQAASGQAMTLRVKIGAGSGALALFNTNAKDVVCTITSDAGETALDVAVAVDKGGGLVGIPCTGHPFSMGDQILLNGTTNYDGVQTVDATSSANEIVITGTYAAETFSGTDTAALVQDTQTWDLQLIDTYARFFADNPRVYRRFWMDYTYQIGACTATIQLTAVTPDIVNAGTVKAGQAFETKNPLYGLNEGRKSYGVKKRLNNGALYGRVRNIVRTFNGSVMLKRRTDELDEYYKFIDVYDQFGEEAPFAALVADGIDDQQWALYCTFDGPPSASHAYPGHSVVSFNWLEEI